MAGRWNKEPMGPGSAERENAIAKMSNSLIGDILRKFSQRGFPTLRFKRLSVVRGGVDLEHYLDIHRIL
jgi:hypothetical protein